MKSKYFNTESYLLPHFKIKKISFVLILSFLIPQNLVFAKDLNQIRSSNLSIQIQGNNSINSSLLSPQDEMALKMSQIFSQPINNFTKSQMKEALYQELISWFVENRSKVVPLFYKKGPYLKETDSRLTFFSGALSYSANKLKAEITSNKTRIGLKTFEDEKVISFETKKALVFDQIFKDFYDEYLARRMEAEDAQFSHDILIDLIEKKAEMWADHLLRNKYLQDVIIDFRKRELPLSSTGVAFRDFMTFGSVKDHQATQFYYEFIKLYYQKDVSDILDEVVTFIIESPEISASQIMTALDEGVLKLNNITPFPDSIEEGLLATYRRMFINQLGEKLRPYLDDVYEKIDFSKSFTPIVSRDHALIRILLLNQKENIDRFLLDQITVLLQKGKEVDPLDKFESFLDSLNSYTNIIKKPFNTLFNTNSRYYVGQELFAFLKARAFVLLSDKAPSQVNQIDRLSNFPMDALLGVRFIEVLDYDHWSEMVEELEDDSDLVLSESLDHKILFNKIHERIRPFLNKIEIMMNLDEYSVQALKHELTMRVLKELNQRKNDVDRYPEISLHDPRDYPQSVYGTSFHSIDFQEIFSQVIDSEIPAANVETWGGAVPQSLALVKHHQDQLQDAFFHARRMTQILKTKLFQAIQKAANIQNLDLNSLQEQEDWTKIFDRFQVKEDRVILEKEELLKSLKSLGFNLENESIQEIARIYTMRQQMLFRGPYTIVLDLFPPEIVKMIIRLAYKNGIDTYRIFIADNDPRQIESVIDYAHELEKEYGKKLGIKVQPVVHFSPSNTHDKKDEQYEVYAKLAERYANKAEHLLDSICIKDAPGTITPDEAYYLMRYFRQKPQLENVHFDLHTHDTAGVGNLAYFEFIRAGGNRIDLSQSYEANGQPNFYGFYQMVKNSSWGTYLPDYTEENLNELRRKVEKVAVKYKEPPFMSLKLRFLSVEGQLPGGMWSNYISQLLDPKQGLPISKLKYKKMFGIEILDEFNNFTYEGLEFLEAYMEQILDEMKRIIDDIGGYSMVTPYSQYVGRQARKNVDFWIGQGYLDYKLQKDGSYKLVFNRRKIATKPGEPTFFEDPNKRYFFLEPSIMNMMIRWVQDSYLQWLNPKVNKEFLKYVMEKIIKNKLTENEYQDLLEYISNLRVDINEEDLGSWMMNDQILSVFQKFKKLAKMIHDDADTDGNPIVDIRTIEYYRTFKNNMKDLTRGALLKEATSLIDSPSKAYMKIFFTAGELEAIYHDATENLKTLDPDSLEDKGMFFLFPVQFGQDILNLREYHLRKLLQSEIDESTFIDVLQIIEYMRVDISLEGLEKVYDRLNISKRQLDLFQDRYKRFVLKGSEVTESSSEREDGSHLTYKAS